jgi:SNF2 family DNA or RNA helicase
MLPPRDEVLLFCRPTDEQCTMYKEMTSAQRGQGLRMEATADALTTLTNLRKLCAHPRWNSASNASKSEGRMDDNYVARSGKLMVLNSLLQSIRAHAPDDKIVIVSNFTSALSLIQDAILRPQGLSYQRLDGSTELFQRHGIVETFNKTSASRNFAFLLSSKAGGCGLNLIGGQSACWAIQELQLNSQCQCQSSCACFVSLSPPALECHSQSSRDVRPRLVRTENSWFIPRFTLKLSYSSPILHP